MKKFLLLMTCMVIMGACVDKDYDLGKDIDTDNVTIGGPESEFVMPLANIHVSSSELSTGNVDITALFSDVEAWIPASYESIEVQRLGDREYIDQWVDDLCKGMDNNDNEFTRVVEYIHKNRWKDFIQCGITPNDDFAIYKEEFRGLWNDNQTRSLIETQIDEIVNSEITTINTEIDPLDCEIQNDGLDEDVIDMLVDAENDGALELFGTILNKMEPIECTLHAEFVSTSVNFDVSLPAAASGTDGNTVAIPDVRIPADDAYAIIDHGSLRVTVNLVKFYPRAAYHEGEQMLVHLKLRKKGGLKVNQ